MRALWGVGCPEGQGGRRLCPLPTIPAMNSYDVCVRGSGPVGMTLALAAGLEGIRDGVDSNESR